MLQTTLDYAITGAIGLMFVVLFILIGVSIGLAMNTPPCG